MASKADVEAGRAFVRLFLKNDMASQLVRALRSAQNKLRDFSQSAMMMGKRLAFAGAAMFAPFALGMREFAKFDAQMGNVSTMLDNPDEFLSGFRQGIKDLAEEFGKTKDDLATGLYDILSATVPPERAMERLAAATKLAAGGNGEVGDSVAVLNTLMDHYGDSFKDAGDASDFLFAIVKRGRTNLSELSGHLGDIIATAKAAGMSVEDMGAAVALLTRATGGTDSALTALQAISATFLKPGTEGAALWEQKFGEAMDAGTLKAIGMTGVLERLSTLDPGDVAKIFPNLRALRGIFPAISKMQGFSEDLEGMANRAGNVDTAFEKIKGPLFFWNQGLEIAKNIMLEIGGAVTSAILPYKDAILAAAKATAMLIRNNKGVVVAVAASAAGVGLLGVALIGMGMAAFLASFACGALATIVVAMTSPIGLIVSAVLAAAVAFVRWTESGRAAYQSISSMLGKLLGRFREVFVGISEAIKSGNVGLAFDVMKTAARLALVEIAARVTYVFRDLIPGLASAAFAGLAGAWGAVIGMWREPIIAVWDFFKVVARGAFKFIGVAFMSGMKQQRDLFVAAWNLYSQIAKVALGCIGPMFHSQMLLAVDIGRAMWDAVKGFGLVAMQNVVAGFINAYIVLPKFIAKTLAVMFYEASKFLLASLIKAVVLWATFTNKIAHGIAGVISDALMGKMPTGAKQLLSLQATSKDTAMRAMDTAGDLGMKALADAGETLMDSGGAAIAGLSGEHADAGQVVSTFGGDVAKAMKDEVGRGAATMQQAVEQMKPAISQFSTDIYQAATEHAERIKAAGIDAAKLIGPAAAQLAEATKGMSKEAKAAFLERFQAAFAEVKNYKDPEAVSALRNNLNALIADATKTKGAAAEQQTQAGAGAGAGGAGGAGGDGVPVTARPRGVALTATYSAAAARISGYQPGGGPEKKMADGIDKVARYTEDMAIQMGLFLAGWRVA